VKITKVKILISKCSWKSIQR